MTRGRAKPRSQRQLRVGEEIRHALARILGRGELRDPQLAGIAVTVTEVRVTADLKSAHAFVLPFGGGDPAAVAEALQRAAPFLRGRLAHEVTLRSLPALYFVPDTSFDQASTIDRLLRDPRVARDLDRENGDGA